MNSDLEEYVATLLDRFESPNMLHAKARVSHWLEKALGGGGGDEEQRDEEQNEMSDSNIVEQNEFMI